MTAIFTPAPLLPLCPDRGLAPLSEIEAHRHGATARVDAVRAAFARCRRGAGDGHARHGAVAAGRVGFDDPVIAAVMAHHEHPGAAIPADNILREIRLIKSPLEVALMARAAEANAAALMAVGKAARAGARITNCRRSSG